MRHRAADGTGRGGTTQPGIFIGPRVPAVSFGLCDMTTRQPWLPEPAAESVTPLPESSLHEAPTSSLWLV